MAETLELLTRRATLTPSTYDEESRTIEAVISTFSPVQRAGFIERLDPAGLDTSRLVGAPVLDGHRQGSARDVIGTVTAYRMDGQALVATIRLSGAADAAPIIERIQEGTIKGVSIGYRVTKWTESTDPQTRQRVRTAAAWSISEVSAVPVPADSGSTFRSNHMPEEIQTVEPNSTETRAALIARVNAAFDLGEDWCERMANAEDEITDDEIRADGRRTAASAMQTRTTPVIRTQGPQNDDPAVQMTRRADALFAQVSGTAPTDAARPFMADRLSDHMRACVEAAGVSTRGMSQDDLVRAAMHTTPDFQGLLTNTGNRTLMGAYTNAASPIKTTLARSTTLSDFRPATKLKLSDIGLLKKVTESGEITHTTRGETSESYALETYATQFALSRKAIYNDDLGAFADWARTAGRMAAETENNLLVQLVLSNPVMGEDAKALFHADHGNLGTGADLGQPDDINAVDAARKSMRQMKGLDGTTPINATPRYLVVGPESETAAEKLLASIYATTFEDANPFTGKLQLLVEPRITDTSWYVFADPAILPVLEYAYLSSAQGPQMASREGWDVLGMEMRVVLDFGAGVVDWRGAYLNPGE